MRLDLDTEIIDQLPRTEREAVCELIPDRHPRASILNALLHFNVVYQPDIPLITPAEFLQWHDADISSAEILSELITIWDQFRDTPFGLQLGEEIIHNFLSAFIAEELFRQTANISSDVQDIHALEAFIHRDSLRMLFETVAHTNTIMNMHEDKLRHIEALANTDALTGLASRRRLNQFLEEHNAEDGVIVYIDLNNFKPINDRLGHDVGDKALREVGERMRAILPDTPSRLIARYGGDEIVVVLMRTSLKQAHKFANYLLATMVHGDVERGFRKLEYTNDKRTERLSASIGLADTHDGMTLKDTMTEADTYMFAAKAKGKEGHVCSAMNTDKATLRSIQRQAKIDGHIRSFLPPLLYAAYQSGKRIAT